MERSGTKAQVSTLFPTNYGYTTLAEGRTIPASSAGPALWADAAGFYLLPALLRTWAPVAQTPVIRRKLSYDHLSAISMTGDLYLAVQDHAYQSSDVIEFLKQLLAALPGKLLVIWDGVPIHRSRAVKEYLSQRSTCPKRGRDGSGWSSCLAMHRS